MTRRRLVSLVLLVILNDIVVIGALLLLVRPLPPVAPPIGPVVPAVCPTDWLCYERVQVAGQVVPYEDCLARTDIGTSIRRLSCLNAPYFAGHAYTQFGNILGWKAGDIVFALGQRYVVTGAITASSCEPPALPLAAISLQTSLSGENCGPVLVVQGAAAPTAPTASVATGCPSVGPPIPPPIVVPSGLPGFHATWYGQSGYPTLCAGQRATATVAFRNSGSSGWVLGRQGETAYLGTWDPEPGQDRASVLGGDGTSGSPNTAWPRFNRPAVQPASYVGPDQIAWFQFVIEAPAQPGLYRVALRPLIEGATWLEDYGVFWYVTVIAR